MFILLNTFIAKIEMTDRNAYIICMSATFLLTCHVSLVFSLKNTFLDTLYVYSE